MVPRISQFSIWLFVFRRKMSECPSSFRSPARDLLARVYDWFTEGFDTSTSKSQRRCSSAWLHDCARSRRDRVVRQRAAHIVEQSAPRLSHQTPTSTVPISARHASTPTVCRVQIAGFPFRPGPNFPRPASWSFSFFSHRGFRLRQVCVCGLVIALSDKNEDRV